MAILSLTVGLIYALGFYKIFLQFSNNRSQNPSDFGLHH